MSIDCYAMYYTKETSGEASGYVHNRVLWDGVSEWEPPDGSAIIKDNPTEPHGAVTYPIGSTVHTS